MSTTAVDSYTAGVPAIDHHSHAGYVRPGEELEGIDGLEREYAMGHVEANIPHDAFAAYIEARVRQDAKRLAQLEQTHGIPELISESVRFQATTVHGSSLLAGSRALYGDLNYTETVRVSRERRRDDFPGLYGQALDLSNTAAVLTDIPFIDGQQWSQATYKPIARIDPYLYPFGHPTFRRRGSDSPRFQRIFGVILSDLLETEGLDSAPTTLGEYLAFVRASIIRRQEEGFVGLKIASAYVRSLRFTRRATADAEAAYAQLRTDSGALESGAYETLADYLVFAIAELAVERQLPIQIHTGMGHSEPGLLLTGADPRNLESLFSDPALNRLRVILIHGGYPYTSYLAAISQAHGNVFVDFSWMPYLQHHTVERLLQEWLEVLPANKVLFGTDTGQPEFHVAATERARLLLDRALTAGVTDRLWTVGQAEWLAQRVLRDNLCDLYGLELP